MLPTGLFFTSNMFIVQTPFWEQATRCTLQQHVTCFQYTVVRQLQLWECLTSNMETCCLKGSYSCWDVSIQLSCAFDTLYVDQTSGLASFPGSPWKQGYRWMCQEYITYYQYEENLVGCTYHCEIRAGEMGIVLVPNQVPQHIAFTIVFFKLIYMPDEEWNRTSSTTRVSRVGKESAWCLLFAQVSMVTCILLHYTKIRTNFSLPADSPQCRTMLPVRHIQI